MNLDMESTRLERTKRTFRIAHPPPQSNGQKRLHVQPKRLLQLQRWSEGSRPQPEFDVVPIAHHRDLRQLKIEQGLEKDDMLILSTQNSDVTDDLAGRASLQDKGREVVAKKHFVSIFRFANSPNKRPTDTVQMADSSVWRAHKLRSGTYEFASLDQHPDHTVARWAPKQNTRDVSSGNENAPPNIFTFSLLSPHQRRHPIIATLTAEAIEVWDQFSQPRSSQSPLTITSELSYRQETASEPTDEKECVVVTEDLRLFILATGLWVALSQGSSTYFNETHKTRHNKLNRLDEKRECRDARKEEAIALTKILQSSPNRTGLASNANTDKEQSHGKKSALTILPGSPTELDKPGLISQARYSMGVSYEKPASKDRESSERTAESLGQQSEVRASPMSAKTSDMNAVSSLNAEAAAKRKDKTKSGKKLKCVFRRSR